MAYCLDEAVVFFGFRVEQMLDEAGHKPDRKQRAMEAAQRAVLNRVLGDKKSGSGFADPALMF